MHSHPLTPWLDFGKSSLLMLNQLPDSQARFAQLMKTALELGQQLRQAQADAAVQSLQAQLEALDRGAGASALRDLLDLQFGLANSLSDQWKSALERLAKRSETCIGDLRKAQTQDDVLAVTALLMKDLGESLHKDAEQSGTLFNSARAATSVLIARALDGMAGAQEEPGGPA